MEETLKKRITEIIENNRIVLFMKGDQEVPQCGFSSQAVQILKATGADFCTVDVLTDLEIRQGMKEFSNWPTFPQLYVAGQFIGGCDIMREMYESGELNTTINGAKVGNNG